MKLERDRYDYLLCPLCPPGGWSLSGDDSYRHLIVAWDVTTIPDAEGEDYTTAAQHHSWRVTDAQGQHVLATSGDWYEDLESPPAPTEQQIIDWLADGAIPSCSDD